MGEQQKKHSWWLCFAIFFLSVQVFAAGFLISSAISRSNSYQHELNRFNDNFEEYLRIVERNNS